jgi:hypothetical protein
MEVGIFGDFNSLGTGQNILKKIWKLTKDQGAGLEVSSGWEINLADKFPLVTFEVFFGQSNQEILNKLILSIQSNKPKDLYIVQTMAWFGTTMGILDHKVEPFKIKHNLIYNIINPHSHIGKRYYNSIIPYHPNFVIKKKPGQHLTKLTKGTGTLHSVFTAFERNANDFSNKQVADINLIYNDVQGMTNVYDDYTKVLLKDHMGSQLKQEETYATMSMLNLLSKTHNNIWYFHWEPSLGRIEDFNAMVQISGGRSDDRKKSRQETLGLNYAKLERLDTSKRIHLFSVMDYLIMTYRNKIDNCMDDYGFVNEEMHKIIFDEYISSNDTLMNIFKNG